MPKEPVAGNTRQPPKRQAPSHKPQAPVASTAQGELVQRAMADPTSLSPADVAALQRTVGNRAVQRLLARPDPAEIDDTELDVQTKLVVGPANDAYEREADQVAQGVVRQIGSGSSSAAVQRATSQANDTSLDYDEEEEQEMEQPRGGRAFSTFAPPGQPTDEDDDKKVRLKRAAQSVVGLQGGDVATPIEGHIQQERGSGQPLHGGVRASMEAAFQADFSRVRVHHNRQSDHLNRQLSARAFTTGQDLFFKQGEYNPHTTSGKTLLAHELTHVVQQNGAAVRRKANKEPRRANASVRARAAGPTAQRVTWDYASQEREKWKKRNTASKIAMVPLGGVYGAGKGAMQGYQGLYNRLRGAQGANASTGRKLLAGVGSAVLGTLALPFTALWGGLRGMASGLINPIVSAGKRAPGAWQGIKNFFRQGVGSYRSVPQEQRGQVDGSSPVAETAPERESRLTALMGRRGPLPEPGPQGGAPRGDTALTRGENVLATGAVDLGGYAATGIGAAAAGGRTLTGWSSGATDANFGSSLSGATEAFGTLGAGAGLAGTLAAVADARSGFNQATDAQNSSGERALSLGQGLSSTGDALKQSSTAAFNIASLTGNAAAAAAATVVAGGAGVAMGVIDVLRGTAGAITANKRVDALLALISETEREATLTQGEKLRLITAAREGIASMRTRLQTGAVTAVKGAVTIAGGALLIAAGLTNPVGWALLGGAALIGAIYALYKLREKSKRKRHLAVRELGIGSWRMRWKARKKAVEEATTWGSEERRRRMRQDVGEDPLDITLRSQGYESPGHFYAVYIKTTAQTIYDNAVAGPEPDPQKREDDYRLQMVRLVESMGLRIDRSKEKHTPTVKRIAEVLDN